MKRKIILTSMIAILLTVGTLYAQPKKNQEYPREKLRNALQVRQEMMRIEKETIKNDTELQSIAKEIERMHQQMRERLDNKLIRNPEYQEKKKELEQLKYEWLKRRPEPVKKPSSSERINRYRK